MNDDPDSQLARFLEIIGLANTFTFYERLRAGRTDGVARFAEFVHV
jgi:hypothetical protein